MKKIYLLVWLLIASLHLTQAQNVGKWVLALAPENSQNNTSVSELTFQNTPTLNSFGIPVGFDVPCQAATGGYTLDYTRKFTTVNKILSWTQNDYIDWLISNKNLPPEIQIIPKPGIQDRFIIFYGGVTNNGYGPTTEDDWFGYKEIYSTQANPWSPIEWNATDRTVLTSGGQVNVLRGMAFAITDETNLSRRIYLCSNFIPPSGTSNQGVVEMWSINSQGVDLASRTTILDWTSSNLALSEGDFMAYNMEVKTDANGNDVLAWIVSPNSLASYLYVYEVENGDMYKINLGQGRIGGIEFAPGNGTYIYVSATNATGILKVDYTGSNSTVVLGNSAGYNRSFLQTAPDGNIYACANNGTNLGRILASSGLFVPNCVSFPSNKILSTYKVFDNLKYFILPEDHTPCIAQLTATATTTYIAPCQNTGTATVTATGGTAPYTYQWTPSVTNPAGQPNVAINLAWGSYTCIVTDAYGYTATVTINITYDPNLVVSGLNPIANGPHNNETKVFKDGFIVQAGTSVTLTNCNYQFMPGAKVIVEQGSAPGASLVTSGGLLTLNGSTLSSVPACNGFWKGVEVMGNPSANQLVQNGICRQGRIVMRNSSTIKDAEVGVLLASRNPNGSINYTQYTGGIVKVENDFATNTYGGKFINNTYGVLFTSYHHHITSPTIENDNVSNLTDCLFEVNASYLGTSWFYSHLYMNDVKGVAVNGCKFKQTKSATPNGHGINAYHSGFKVQPLCNAQMSPCQPQYMVKSSFENFAKGINLLSSGTYSMYVDKTLFTGNSRGISIENSDYAVVLNSTFSIGKPYDLDEQLCEDGGAAAYGIYMSTSTGFAIEENSFAKAQGAPTGNYIGIYIAETQATDQVYKNTFTGLSYGNYAVGRNFKLGEQWKGLAYYCNQNTGNHEDFTVEDKLEQVDGVQDPQGSELMPAGNTFSPNATYQFNNWDENDWIGYYYYAPAPGVTNTVYYPEYINRVTREPVVGIQNTCPSHYGGGNGGSSDGRSLVLTPEERQEAELEFADNLSDYTNVKTLYDNLRDGGNTGATITDIETAWPDDMWELRAELLGKSPHLSMDVLKATADNTEVLPDNIIFEILAANPDELKKEELIKYLEDKENPLPGYMIDILKQVAMGSTYKTVLIRHMAHYNQLKTKAAYDIVRSILNDSVIDNNQLHDWLDNIGGKRADEQIIASYIGEANYSSATTLANMMPALYDYSNDDIAEHNNFMEMLNLQIALANEERTIFDLDSTEVNNLVYIAENSKGTAGAQAKGILEYAYGYQFCNCINADSSGYKSSSVFNPNSFEQLLGIEISVEPNPVKDWAAFNFTLPDSKSEGAIQINNAEGKLVETLLISGKQGQIIWDTREIKPGVYFYTLNVSGFNRTGKMIISK